MLDKSFGGWKETFIAGMGMRPREVRWGGFVLVCLLLVGWFELRQFKQTVPLVGQEVSATCWVPPTQRQPICAPHFIIAGAMKSGTTSLYSYLQMHPLVLPLATSSVVLPSGSDGEQLKITALGEKEIRYFNKQVYGPLRKKHTRQETFEAYLRFFPEISADESSPYRAKDGFITGEASPSYLVSSQTS